MLTPGFACDCYFQLEEAASLVQWVSNFGVHQIMEAGLPQMVGHLPNFDLVGLGQDLRTVISNKCPSLSVPLRSTGIAGHAICFSDSVTYQRCDLGLQHNLSEPISVLYKIRVMPSLPRCWDSGVPRAWA
jgi:hypothetical protein